MLSGKKIGFNLIFYQTCAAFLLVIFISICIVSPLNAARTEKPVLHGKHWVAITGKPLGATAGAMIFQKGGNAVDAACAMLGAVCTMYDVLSWGGETQALIYNPITKKVYGINALGVAPTGATPEFFRSKGLDYPPAYGPLSAVTPGRDAWRIDDNAGRIRNNESKRCLGAKYPDGSWISCRRTISK